MIRSFQKQAELMSKQRKLRRSLVARTLLQNCEQHILRGVHTQMLSAWDQKKCGPAEKDKAKDNAKAVLTAEADIKTEPKVEYKNAACSKGAEAKKAKVEETEASGKVTNKDMQISIW